MPRTLSRFVSFYLLHCFLVSLKIKIKKTGILQEDSLFWDMTPSLSMIDCPETMRLVRQPQRIENLTTRIIVIVDLSGYELAFPSNGRKLFEGIWKQRADETSVSSSRRRCFQ